MSIRVKIVAQCASTLPEGFYYPLHMQVVMLETMMKGVKVDDSLVYDMEKLYGRLLVISLNRDITLENMSYELTPIPSSLFDDYDGLKKSAKSKLVHKLAVVPDVDMVDGNEM